MSRLNIVGAEKCVLRAVYARISIGEQGTLFEVLGKDVRSLTREHGRKLKFLREIEKVVCTFIVFLRECFLKL